jgi:cytochrome b6-f complex iron-sulfur subunit
MARKSHLIASILILLLGIIIPSCKKEKNTTQVNFSIDLSSNTYASLNTVGAYVYKDDVIIAKINSTTFVALSKLCTKDNYSVTYNASIGFFVCSGCAARYDANGNVAFGSPPKSLIKYNTSLSGTILTVTQ